MPSDMQFEPLCRLMRGLFRVPVAAVSLDGGKDGLIDAAHAGDRDGWPFLSAFLKPLGRLSSITVMDEARLALDLPKIPFAPPFPRPRFAAVAPFGDRGEGKLVLFDSKARAFKPADIRRLGDFAALAEQSWRLSLDLRRVTRQENDFRLLAEASTDTIVRGDLDGNRLYISPSVKTLLGYEPGEMIGRQAAGIVHPDDAESFRALMERIREGQLEIGVTEVRQQHKDGSWVWMEASIRLTRDPATGEANGYVASVRGIGRRKETEARLEHLASHDPLTGLPNRAVLGHRLIESLAETRRTGRPFALLCMDLDRFKQVNDTLGHQAGDQVLCEAANRFRAHCRPNDIIARLGGDEFALILSSSPASSGAAAIAQRLIQAMAAPIFIQETPVSVGLSIGIARAPGNGTDPDSLFAAADRALYEAKTAGRNRFCFSGGGV